MKLVQFDSTDKFVRAFLQNKKMQLKLDIPITNLS